MNQFYNIMDLKLIGKAKNDFYDWYYLKWNNCPSDMEEWHYQDQLDKLSEFFNVKIYSEVQFKEIQDKYNQA